MEVEDGFVVRIDAYCDRWCETCAFTSRCRAFASYARMEAQHDPNLKPVSDAPPLPQDIPPPPPEWLQEMIAEMNEAAEKAWKEEKFDSEESSMTPEHQQIETRATAYGGRVDESFERLGFDARYPLNDPRSVIRWFQSSISAKAYRALTGLTDPDLDDVNAPNDQDGSAKVALIGIERSHAAWLQLVENGLASADDVQPLIADLIWLADQLDRVFPRARAFVRPAFDEPDEVAKLLALDGLPG
jgi:hypothetical protein